MAAFERVASGIPQMDECFDNIRLGDNVVWRVDRLEDFRLFAEPYVRLGCDWDLPPRKIEPGHVYVMGDNRSVSRDSRYETVGPIPLYRVVGKVRLVLFPFKKAHLI